VPEGQFLERLDFVEKPANVM
jgi:hypothetical protein